MAKKYLNIGKMLKKLLFDHNMRAADLARKVHVPPPTIHRLISGKSTRPYKSSLKPIADFFSITVDQLLGEENLPENLWEQEQGAPLIATSIVKSIPIISWQRLSDIKIACKESQKNIVTLGNLSDLSFALVMPDFSMEPLFTQGTLLIFDPQQPIKDRSYVLVKLIEKNHSLFMFRQILIDGDDRYLKPLNPDLSMFKMRLLNEEDQIVACLIESRNQYLPDDRLKLLEEI